MMTSMTLEIAMSFKFKSSKYLVERISRNVLLFRITQSLTVLCNNTCTRHSCREIGNYVEELIFQGRVPRWAEVFGV